MQQLDEGVKIRTKLIQLRKKYIELHNVVKASCETYPYANLAEYSEVQDYGRAPEKWLDDPLEATALVKASLLPLSAGKRKTPRANTKNTYP